MAFSQTRLHAMQYHPVAPPRRPDLALLEVLYYVGVKCHAWLYANHWLQRYTLPVPVISIGNLTTGGTGKTPVTLSLAQFLEAKNLKVAILSRGYGRNRKTDCHIADDPRYGDEPYMLQQQLRQGKVFVGRNRVLTGRQAIETFQPDIIILDDGFQHLPLNRDMDIVLVDGQYQLGNGHLLPVGPLREPANALKRADYILVTKQTPLNVMRLVQDWVSQSRPVLPCPFHTVGLMSVPRQEPIPWQHVADKAIALVSGIAQPQSFETSVQALIPGINIQHHFIYADHYAYTAQEAQLLARHLDGAPDRVLMTTEKDWVKLQGVLDAKFFDRVFVLRIAPDFDWMPVMKPVLERMGVPH